MSSWLPALKSHFGDNVCTDAATLDAMTAQGIRPACVVAPETTEDAATIICYAAEHKIPILPRGSGTAQGLGYPPPPNALVLSTRRLNKLIHHEPGDMVATVQAGMDMGAFQKALGERGQWLPLDAENESTIGGMIATNRYGTRAHGYGTLRDMVLGMTVINGDGVIRKCGGKVVKNVTGYALDKLYIGSFGTLGLVTEVTFKLRPLPIKRHEWEIKASDWNANLDALQAVASRNLPLESLIAVKDKFGCRVAASASGTETELDRINNELNAVSSAHLNETGAVVPNGNDATLRFWSVGSELKNALDVVALCEESGSISVGVNGGEIVLPGLTVDVANKIARGLTAIGVNFRFENAAGAGTVELFGPPRPEWTLMKQIKSALDPQGIMNPGRFVV